jgi:hypothetical protein
LDELEKYREIMDKVISSNIDELYNNYSPSKFLGKGPIKISIWPGEFMQTKTIIQRRNNVEPIHILKAINDTIKDSHYYVIYYWDCKHCFLADIQETCVAHEKYTSCEEMEFDCPCCKRKVAVTKVQIFRMIRE